MSLGTSQTLAIHPSDRLYSNKRKAGPVQLSLGESQTQQNNRIGGLGAGATQPASASLSQPHSAFPTCMFRLLPEGGPF